MGSPPPSGTKKVVPKLRSVRSMVIAPARTGRASSSMKAVTSIDHAKSGILCSVMPGARMLKMVVMKLIAPSTDDAPDRCIERMTKSTAGPGWPVLEYGGESGQPPPGPVIPGAPGANIEPANRTREAPRTQHGTQLKLGHATAGAP